MSLERWEGLTREEFVRAAKAQTSDAAVFGTISNLHKPPGRKPRVTDISLSTWFNNLSESDEGMVFAAMKEAAELAVFSFFCILDGVSAIEDRRDKGDLKLSYVNGLESTMINGDRGTPLHDLFNALCRSSEPVLPDRDSTRMYAVGLAGYLRSLQTSRDGLDVHPVPASDDGEHTAQSPAVALPKNEHRKV